MRKNVLTQFLEGKISRRVHCRNLNYTLACKVKDGFSIILVGEPRTACVLEEDMQVQALAKFHQMVSENP